MLLGDIETPDFLGLFPTRSACARRARREGITSFRSVRVGNQGYRLFKSPNPPSVLDAAIAYAEAVDWATHVEVWPVDEGRKPGQKVVLIVTCFKDELPDDIPPSVELEPVTPSLWESDDKEGFEHRKRETSAGPRAKSDVESPTKLVWKIADELMTGLTALDKEMRGVIINKCVEAGVNKSTAQTQLYRWAKANGK